MEYYSAIKKEILPFATTWMGLKSILLSELEKDKCLILCSRKKEGALTLCDSTDGTREHYAK